MDHIDFSGSTFNTPVIGKSVTTVSSTTNVARPDDKVYVVVRREYMIGDWESEATWNVGVAMTLEAAVRYIRNWRDKDGYFKEREIFHPGDGTIIRSFETDDEEHMQLSIDILDVL